MRKTFTTCLFILLTTGTALLASGNEPRKGTQVTAKNASAIDALDSVYFDLSQATINGSFLEFPVYIQSDDSIVALDFEFKYNQLNFQYDGIANLTTYIDMLAYYNPNDSVVRLTSYSISQNFAQNTPLFSVRFNIISGQFCIADIYNIVAMLNGDVSSFRIIDCQPNGLNDEQSTDLIGIFPNPAADLVQISATTDVTVEIIDIASNAVILNSGSEDSEMHQFDLSTLANGVYLVRAYNGTTTATRKLIVSH